MLNEHRGSYIKLYMRLEMNETVIEQLEVAHGGRRVQTHRRDHLLVNIINPLQLLGCERLFPNLLNIMAIRDLDR